MNTVAGPEQEKGKADPPAGDSSLQKPQPNKNKEASFKILENHGFLNPKPASKLEGYEKLNELYLLEARKALQVAKDEGLQPTYWVDEPVKGLPRATLLIAESTNNMESALTFIPGITAITKEMAENIFKINKPNEINLTAAQGVFDNELSHSIHYKKEQIVGRSMQLVNQVSTAPIQALGLVDGIDTAMLMDKLLCNAPRQSSSDDFSKLKKIAGTAAAAVAGLAGAGIKVISEGAIALNEHPHEIANYSATNRADITAIKIAAKGLTDKEIGEGKAAEPILTALTALKNISINNGGKLADKDHPHYDERIANIRNFDIGSYVKSIAAMQNGKLTQADAVEGPGPVGPLRDTPNSRGR